MKYLFCIFAIWASAISASECPKGWICPQNPIYSSDIGIWYSLYWNKPESAISHWKDWARYKPQQGYYTIGDPHTVSAHFTEMREAGIDFVIFDHTNGIGNDAGTIEQNAKAVVETNKKLPEASRLKISVAIGHALWNAKSLEAQKAEADHIWKNYVDDPYYKKIDGKPLLVIYNSIESDKDCFACNWNDSRFSVRRAGGMIDGANPALQKYASEGIWGWAMKSPLIASPEAITVMPGWETRHLGRDTTPIDRKNGEYYMDQWLFAMKNNPRHIIVASWNDWAEENSIEPSTATTGPKWVDSYGVEVPDYYFQITAAYGNLKKGLIAGYYYRDEDDHTVYLVADGKLVAQTAMPHLKAVVKLPAGTIKSLLKPTNATGKIPAGLFKVGATLAYSNGSHYCVFDTMENFTNATGKKDASGITEYPSMPGDMKSDGTCSKRTSAGTSSSVAKIPSGFFKVGSSIGYSNGGNGYCTFNSMDNFIKLTGSSNTSDIKGYASFPTGMQNQGTCQGQ